MVLHDVAQRARRGDFVYFDPPYVPVSATASFTAYTRHGFGEPEQARLAGLFFALAGRGCYVMLSNSSTELARALYAGATHSKTVFASRKINCDGRKRGEVEELIVCSYGPQRNGVAS